jgi:hypothetical protein
MTLKEFQSILKVELERKLQLEVKDEWRSEMVSQIYSPRIDLALGPFATTRDLNQTGEHNALFDNHRDFFYQLAECHLINLSHINERMDETERHEIITQKVDDLRWTNMNARCFVAVEIENAVSRKHLLGGAINCSALGKIGIAIGFTDSKHRAFCNLQRYFQFLESVNKPTYSTKNLVIISKDQILEILSAQ